MHLAILHNDDFAHLPADLTRRSQDAVVDMAHAFAASLTKRGAQVELVAVGAEPLAFLPALDRLAPEVVVNLCESVGGDSRAEMVVPALLELHGYAYTGSQPLALSLALHKATAKDLLKGRGVPTPEHALVEKLEDCRRLSVPLPAIVKPAREDASIGIDRFSVVRTPQELERACARVLERHRQPALVEQFIDGRELNVALLGDPAQVLPIAEIDFSGMPRGVPRIVTYNAKWDEASAEFLGSPPIRCVLPAKLERRVQQVAREAFTAVGCRDYARVDIRLSADGVPYVIEVNPNCDLSPDAGFARAARNGGVDYDALAWKLVELARGRALARSEPKPRRKAARPSSSRPVRKQAGRRAASRRHP